METLKEYRNILLGQKIIVHTDHKNLVYKHFHTERVMRWRLIIEEFGPELHYIKGENNVVADTLSRMEISNDDFSPDCFAADDDETYPLSYAKIRTAQAQDNELQLTFQNGAREYKKEKFNHSDHSYELICNKEGKIVLPASLRVPAVRWYHQFLLHPAETRMELTLGQHYHWPKMRETIKNHCRKCKICARQKKKQLQKGLLPVKTNVEIIPWHTLCIDLIGPYKFGHHKDQVELHCLTMIDPATGWFEIEEIPTKRAD